MRFLALNLQAPLASFGGVLVDNFGNTRLFPAASMVTGLLGNALGYDRTDTSQLARLQQRLVYGAFYLDALPDRMQDFQTARLNERDEPWMNRGWTTSGQPEDRAGNQSPATHIRTRDYLTDLNLHLLIALMPAQETPDLEDLEQALLRPARPLSLGRKPCLPSGPLLAPEKRRFVEGTNVREAALALAPLLPKEPPKWWEKENPTRTIHLMRPVCSQDPADPEIIQPICDERNWQAGVHTGQRTIVIEKIPVEEPKNSTSQERQN